MSLISRLLNKEAVPLAEDVGRVVEHLPSTVHLYRGENTINRGGVFYSDRYDYAKNFATGPRAEVRHVAVPSSVASVSAKIAADQGDVGFKLPETYADMSTSYNRRVKTRRRARANQAVLSQLTFGSR